MNAKIKITELDFVRLSALLNSTRKDKATEITNIEALNTEISRAERVDSKSIEPNFVTMNSVIDVTSTATKKQMTIKIVYPSQADFKKGFVSVLSPLGSALLGYKVGDTVKYQAPAGMSEIVIDKINYQPEASGDFLV